MLSRLCERCVLSSSFVVCAQHTILKHLPLFRKIWKICDQSFVFLSNTNSASTSAAASTSCRLPNKKRLVTTRSDPAAATWGQFLQNSTQTRQPGGKWPRNSPPRLRKISRMGRLWITYSLPKWWLCTCIWERYGRGQWDKCNHIGLHGQSITIAVGWQICKDILGGI